MSARGGKIALVSVGAAAALVWSGWGLESNAVAERIAVGRYTELHYGVSQEHPCSAEAMDARRTGRSSIRVTNDTPALLWKTELGAGELTAPAVASDGTLYLGTQRGVAAVDAEGKPRWLRQVGAVRWPPALTPSGNVVVVTERGGLLELSPWGEVRKVQAVLPAVGPPLVLDSGEVAVAVPDGKVNVFELRGGLLAAISRRHRGMVTIARLSSGLLVSAGADSSMHVFSSDGGLHRIVSLAGEILAGPVVGDDDTIWVVKKDRALVGLSAGGRVRARARLQGRSTMSAPALGRDGALRLGVSGDLMTCIGPDGFLRWNLPVDGSLGPITLDADDVALAVTSRGVLYGVEADGKRRFRVQVNARGARRPVPGKGGVIYIASDTGRLSAWK